MISKGSNASRFEPTVLAMWFLWAVNEYGKKTAEKNLNAFLDAPNVPIIKTLWVLSIEVEERIQLENGLVIVPLAEMPDSWEKEHYLGHDISVGSSQKLEPLAAITFETTITRSYKDKEDSSLVFGREKEFWESSKLLDDASLALNAIDNTWCIPYFSTAYTFPHMPIGPFGGSGGSMPIYSVFGYEITKISRQQVNDINVFLSSFLALPDTDKVRFGRVLSRLSQAKRRDQIEDKILDLGIALEMALLDENKNNHQLSLSFRLRGSWLISSDENERLNIYHQLGDIYKYRSQVAHNGGLCGNNTKQISAVRERFPEFSILAERIVRKLVCEGKPDWSKLILGVI